MTIPAIIGSDGVERRGAGGSDVAAILGFSAYDTPLDAWLRLTGRLAPKGDNLAMELGRELEPMMRRRYVKDTGYALFVPEQPLYSPRPGFEWARATPDGIVVDDGGNWLHGWEAKTEGLLLPPDVNISDFGQVGTDEVPAAYACQALWYMWICELSRWDFSALVAGKGYVEYRLWRDDETIDWMVDEVAHFWSSYIVPDVQPPIDGSEKFRRWFHDRHSKTNGEVLQATEDDEEIIARYVEAHEDEKDAKERKAVHGNRLMARIGDYAGILSPTYGKVPLVRKIGNPKYKVVAEGLAKRAGVPRHELDVMIEESRGEGSTYVTPPRRKRK